MNPKYFLIAKNEIRGFTLLDSFEYSQYKEARESAERKVLRDCPEVILVERKVVFTRQVETDEPKIQTSVK